MKTQHQKLIIIFLIVISTSSCMTTKKHITSASLYKTETGKNIAYASYDKAMALWNID